jgi:putative hemolysin
MNLQIPSAANGADTVAEAASSYSVRLAEGPADLQAAQALRFEVFNVELDEGLAQSWDSGRDADAFDAVCDHLIVTDTGSDQVVGTYRLQTGTSAAAHLGYYCEREFDLSPFEAERGAMLELGRACIDRQHRNFAVLNLLWKGIGTYGRERGSRWMIGCSSLTGVDPAVGWAAYHRLARHHAPAPWRTNVRAPFVCAGDAVASEHEPEIPRLLSAYLSLGAVICAPPALDREFRTIDFLTLGDLHSPIIRAMQRRGRFVV